MMKAESRSKSKTGFWWLWAVCGHNWRTGSWCCLSWPAWLHSLYWPQDGRCWICTGIEQKKIKHFFCFIYMSCNYYYDFGGFLISVQLGWTAFAKGDWSSKLRTEEEPLVWRHKTSKWSNSQIQTYITERQLWKGVWVGIQTMEFAQCMYPNHRFGRMHAFKSWSWLDACNKIKEFAQCMYPNQGVGPEHVSESRTWPSHHQTARHFVEYHWFCPVI